LHHVVLDFTDIEGFDVTLMFFWSRTLLFLGTAVALAACSMGPQITRTQDLSESADIPYQNVLVIALFSSFDVRKKFEKEVVKQLSELGIGAVTGTSMMDTKTPMTRQTYLPMVGRVDADAVLITQVASLDSNASLKDMSPEATYNVRPTYYYNVWDVELTEYVEPPSIEVKSSLVLATQLYSVLRREAIWAIESKSKIVMDASQPGYYPIIVDEAKGIVTHLSSDGLIVQRSR
jgi:hypothetical protein